MKFLLLFILLIIGLITYTYNFVFEKNTDTDSLSLAPMFRRIDESNQQMQQKEEVYISPINIEYLRGLHFDNSEIVIEENLPDGLNYKRYIASYVSEGNKIYGLLTVPFGEIPQGGFSAIVFNHGYIPPKQYNTTQGYVAYVDYLARNGFVVFKIDLRGHGNSEGISTGSYFSPAYTVDAIYALKALQKFDEVNPKKIGIWGHSMSGNLLLRAMLVSSEFKAGVIWSGAVYSYKDFADYGISDNSYVPRERTSEEEKKIVNNKLTEASEEIRKLRSSPEEVDFDNEFWKSISLTQNINYLNAPLQIHHTVNDAVVDINYARDLAKVLKDNNKEYDLHEYEGGGHNIDSPYFEQAMQRTVDFFKENL